MSGSQVLATAVEVFGFLGERLLALSLALLVLLQFLVALLSLFLEFVLLVEILRFYFKEFLLFHYFRFFLRLLEHLVVDAFYDVTEDNIS